jgi:ribonuclease Z
MAAEVARQAGVRRLMLTHFSLRYESEGNPSLEDLAAEARAIFPNTGLAHDFLTVEVPRRA